MSDVIVAWRALRKNAGFTVIAVLTLAVGIGASVTLFSAFDRLVLNPVTIPHPSSLIAVQSNSPRLNRTIPAVSWPRYEAIRAQATLFDAIAISAFDNFTLTGNGDAEQLSGRRVSASFLPTLGIMPAIGRNFTPDEDTPNGPAVCILSHALWQTRYGGKADVLNSTITLNGQPWQVIGIMPPAMTAPYNADQLYAPRVAEVSALSAAQVTSGASYAQAIARMRPGVTIDQVKAELASISRSDRERNGARVDATNTAEPQMFVQSIVGGLGPMFYELFGAVVLVLLIACANVAALFLGRLTARHTEIALRQSLGAKRGQIIRQFLVESMMLSLLAGVVGIGVSLWALSALQSLIGAQLPVTADLTITWRAFIVTVGITIGSALLVGLAPAVYVSRPSLLTALKDGARGSTGKGGRLRSVLIVGEVALSVVLLLCSSLLLVSFVRLQNRPTGFDAAGVATAFAGVNTGRYSTPVQQADFFARVIEEVKREPHVTSAAVAIGLPLSGFIPNSTYLVAGSRMVPLTERPISGLSIVSDDYFTVMRIPLVEGRSFAPTDRADSPHVCIINQALATRLFPEQSALGKILLRGTNAEIQNEIVGVIRDVKTNGVTAPTPDEIYYAYRQFGRPGMNIVARTTSDAATLETTIRKAVARVDSNQPTSFFSTMDASVAASVGPQRIIASLTSIFAGFALALSAVGLYSVIAYLVSQRRSEIGIRIALGAQAGQVVRLIMGSGFRLVVLGLVIGLAAAAGSAQVMHSMLFDVQPFDPLVYATVTVLFNLVAALACLVPSLRATRIDPLVALRPE